MLRQVELARAMIHQPQLLLWDEVLDGLDWDSAREIMELIDNERRLHDITLILTSHRHTRTLMQGMAHRIGILDRGRLLFNGTPDEVERAAADHRRLETLLASPESGLR
jgi:ABC-type multidrug transport system ATPase subunit